MEQVTLTKEELEKFQEFQSQNNDLVIALGQLEMQKLNLDLTRDNIKEELIKLSGEQDAFAKTIQEKYGEGTIDINTGVFTAMSSGVEA
jgi:predicted phosphodiesterase